MLSTGLQGNDLMSQDLSFYACEMGIIAQKEGEAGKVAELGSRRSGVSPSSAALV